MALVADVLPALRDLLDCALNLLVRNLLYLDAGDLKLFQNLKQFRVARVETFAFDMLPAAHALIQGGQSVGKIVICVS